MAVLRYVTRFAVRPLLNALTTSMEFPLRHASHQLESESKQFLRARLPSSWISDEPQNDYGVDMRVQIAEESQIAGKAFVIQLKASATEKAGDSVSVKLKVSTLNYLRSLLEVAILVKYVAAEKEAYWLLLKDVKDAPANQKTLTIRVPRSQRLSEDAWLEIQGYVTQVHYKKLGAVHKTNGPGA